MLYFRSKRDRASVFIVVTILAATVSGDPTKSAPSLAYDPVSRSVLVGAMRNNERVIGVALNGFGNSPGPAAFLSTVTISPISGNPADGIFEPTVCAGSGGMFGVIYNGEFRWGVFERHLLAPAGSPGPSFGG